MNKPLSSRLAPMLALAAALILPGLLPQSAHGMYDPKHGRWLQRDPKRYVDGMSLYQYVKSRPAVYVDWWGGQASQPTTRPPGSGPSIPPLQIPDYEKIKKRDRDAWYVEWPEQLDSVWHGLAVGKLDHCPGKLELPPSLESVLREALRRTLEGRQIVSSQPNVSFEHSGVMVYHEKEAASCEESGRGSVRHRAYGPKESSSPSMAVPEYALPSGGVAGWRRYGYYHTHNDPVGRDSTFSSSDFFGLITHKDKIMIVRNCRCTRAVVALKGADYDRLHAWAKTERGRTSWEIDRVEERERDQAEMLMYADKDKGIAMRFCYYRVCDEPDQRILRLWP